MKGRTRAVEITATITSESMKKNIGVPPIASKNAPSIPSSKYISDEKGEEAADELPDQKGERERDQKSPEKYPGRHTVARRVSRRKEIITRQSRKNPISTSPAVKVYTSAGLPVAFPVDKTVAQEEEAKAKGSPEIGAVPDALTGVRKSHVVVDICISFSVALPLRLAALAKRINSPGFVNAKKKAPRGADLRYPLMGKYTPEKPVPGYYVHNLWISQEVKRADLHSGTLL